MKKIFYTSMLLLLAGLWADGVRAQEIDGANIIPNPYFDVDAAGWGNYFDYFWAPTNPSAASGNVSVVTKDGYSGKACKVTIFNAGVDGDYSVQISASAPLEAGKKYAIRFKASADANRKVVLSCQENVGAKNTWFYSEAIMLTTTPAEYGPYEFTASTTDPSNLFKFYLGGGGAANGISAYFDEVQVVERINAPGATVPGVPTIGLATAGSSRATVSFTAPANDGGINIKSYTVTSDPEGITATGTASPITVFGLTNGQPYTFTVVANNGLGASSPSAASNSVTPIFKPASYYVSSISGNDNNSGLTIGAPLATIPKASSLMLPGDTALIMTGNYQPFTMSKSGSSINRLTYKAYPGDKPVVTCGINGDWSLLQISASYITVDGIEFKGINDQLTLAQAEANYDRMIAQKNDGLTPDYQSTVNTNTNGISIGNGTEVFHHITVKNCKVHDCSAGGIGAGNSDYVVYENNEIYNNGWYTMFATSGITAINMVSIDNNTGEKIIIRGNRIYNNYTQVKWIDIEDYSDGNGIIIDINTGYKAAFLVENNVVFDNGGRGLYIIEAGNATFRNNTSYWNSKSPFSDGGEMVCYNVHDVKYVNNIGWANPAYASGNYGIRDDGNWGSNKNITWKNNITFNGTVGQKSTFLNKTTTTTIDNTNKTGVNPFFINASIDPATANFKIIQQNSPAINAGTDFYGLPVSDIAYAARVQGTSVDIGAYEANPATLPVNLISFNAKRIDAGSVVLNWKTAEEVLFAYFDLERADDNRSFEKIANIKSNGPSKTGYEYTDNNAIKGYSYYRLKMVDKDGQFSYSTIIAIANGEYGNALSNVYPNPVSGGFVTIDVTAKEAGVWSLSATNTLGQKVTLQSTVLVKGANRLKVNVAALPAGVHFIKLENNGEVFIRKLVKN